MLTRRQVLTSMGRAAAGLAGLGAARAGAAVASPTSAWGAPATPRPIRKVNVVLGGPLINEGFVTVAVGQHLGYYRDEGLEIVLIPSGGSNQAVQEVGAGKIPIGLPSPDPVILGYQPDNNLKLKWVYTAYQGFIFDLRVVAGSPIRSIRDLAGKTIGVVNLASAAVPAARAMVHENGVDPKTVGFVAIGAGAQAAVALRSGRVDAAALWDTIYAEVEQEGVKFNPPFVSPTLKKLFSNGVVVTPRTFESDRDTIVGICRAMAKGTVWTLANPDQAVRIFWHVYPASKAVGLGEEEAFRRSRIVLGARLANMTLDWVPIKRWGWNDPTRWAAYEKFLFDQGIEKERVDTTQVYTNGLIADINRFAADAIAAHARAYVFAR